LFRKDYCPTTEVILFGGMGITHPLRFHAICLVDSIAWEIFIFTLVVLNSIVLALTSSGGEDTTTTGSLAKAGSSTSFVPVLRFFEVLFQICFTYEAALLITAHGMVIHSSSYFRKAWNVFDFITLIASWIVQVCMVQGPILHLFLVIKTLRPLRFLRLIPELRRLLQVRCQW